MRQLDEEVMDSVYVGVESDPTVEEVEPEVKRVFESQADKVLDTRSASEIEKDLIKRSEEAAINLAKNQKPEDLAAQAFGLFLPLYKQHVSKLSNKEARRVLQFLVEYPLNENEVKFNTEDGKSAFALGMRLLECKNIMIATVEMERIQSQLQKQADEEQAKSDSENQVVETTQGETNGETNT